MATETKAPSAVDRSAGRFALWSGIGLAVLAIVACVLQYAVAKILKTPWYVPAVTTVGVGMVYFAVARRGVVIRKILLILVFVLAVFEWFMVAYASRLPGYAGPAVESKMPAFRTALADGRSFTDADLADGTSTVMTFFRGRW